MRYVLWVLIALLIVLHQDNWLWDDARLLWGFLPIGLAYHVCISVAAAATWFLATVYCWPRELEAAEETTAQGGRPQ